MTRLKKMKKNNIFYGLYKYDKDTNQEIRVAVDKSEKFINNLLDCLVQSGASRKNFRIVKNVSKKPFCLQYKLDDFTLEL